MISSPPRDMPFYTVTHASEQLLPMSIAYTPLNGEGIYCNPLGFPSLRWEGIKGRVRGQGQKTSSVKNPVLPHRALKTKANKSLYGKRNPFLPLLPHGVSRVVFMNS